MKNPRSPHVSGTATVMDIHRRFAKAPVLTLNVWKLPTQRLSFISQMNTPAATVAERCT